MQQTLRRIELLVVLGHTLLGSRGRSAEAENLARVARIVALVERDVAAIEMPKERERLKRELAALAERIPDPRVTSF